MSSVKDRIIKKIQEKNKKAQELWDQQSKIKIVDSINLKPKAHVVKISNEGFKTMRNDEILTQNSYRVNQIFSIVERQVEKIKLLTKDQLKQGRENLTIAVPLIWVQNYIESCAQICYSDKAEFTNSRIVDYFDYKIIALDIPSTPFQNRLDLLTLIWFRILHNSKKPVGKDIIISQTSLRYFINYIIGLEFYYTLCNNEFVKNAYPDLLEHEISVMSYEFGEFRLLDLNNVKRYDENNIIMYNDWKSFPHPFHF